MNPFIVIVIIAVIGVAYYLIHKHQQAKANSLPPSPPRVYVPPKPAPIPKPAPAPAPAPAPSPTPVLKDRNGKVPGDVGYDPRADRRDFSPVEPIGSFYGEGPFNPNARWVGPDGFHNAG